MFPAGARMASEAALHSVFGTSTRPVVVAGPCSAETRDQVLETARALAAAGVRVFRAGVWKPRSRPGAFEGRGREALEWLREVRRETGMKVATEVSGAAHASRALEAGVDVLWIGARTTAHTFAVDEIAAALAGADVAVLVKNPMSPDADLWLGALERLERAGVRRLAAVHRGFSPGRAARSRNEPRWNLALELSAARPDVPMLCDPSHIGGRRELVAELSQTAMDLGYDGLMVESHVRPQTALTDAAQQLAPADLAALLSRLVLRRSDAPDDAFHRRLAELRSALDDLDADLVDLLARRMGVSEEIGRLKAASDVAILQRERWDRVLARVLEGGAARGLAPAFVERVFTAIHEESIEHQTRVMGGAPPQPDPGGLPASD